MAFVYSVLMNKGGVGKTTLVTNLASALHLRYPSKKILIVDTDGQGNCALAFNIKPDGLKDTIYDCMVSGLPVDKAIIPIRENFDLLPANDDMNFFELDVMPNLKGRNPFSFLAPVIDQVRDSYDYIFIDSPPDMKVVAGNIMMVTNIILLPFKPEVFSVQGLIRVVKKIGQFKKDFNVKPAIGGVIGMMIKHTNLHSGLMLQADAYCKKTQIPFFDARVPDKIKFADSIKEFGMPITLALPKSEYAQVYFELLEEVIGSGSPK
jgi:chromosome partitioning protein